MATEQQMTSSTQLTSEPQPDLTTLEQHTNQILNTIPESNDPPLGDFREPEDVPMVNSKGYDLDYLNNSPAFSSIRIDENKIDSNIVCDVCKDNEHEDDDEMVICDLCLVGVHQSCYQ